MLTFDFENIGTIDDVIFDMETPGLGFAIDPDREHTFSVICGNLLVLSLNYGDGKINVSAEPEDIDAFVSADLSDIFIYKQNMKTLCDVLTISDSMSIHHNGDTMTISLGVKSLWEAT